MSAVPPSPAHTTTLTSSMPRTLRAARTPEATAAAEANATFITGILKVVLGYAPWMIAEQLAGMTRIVLLPKILRVNLRLRAAPQPMHDVVPRMYSSLGSSFIQLILQLPPWYPPILP